MNITLDKLSLLAFVTIHQVFTGAYMTKELRKWYIEVDVRLEPRYTFTLIGPDLDAILIEALNKVYVYYTMHHKDLLGDDA